MNQRQFVLMFISLSLSIGLNISCFDASQQTPQLKEMSTPDYHKVLSRWNHARELMGRNYQESIVRVGERVMDMDLFVHQLTRQSLSKKWKYTAKEIAQTIIQQSNKFHFDPIFLMAVIANESNFNPEALGEAGEIGLMQIKAEAAQWIANRYHIPWTGPESLYDPKINIIIGAAYLSHLRQEFNFESQLYLAAYNMGSSNVYKILGKQSRPRVYPRRVMHRYISFYTRLRKQQQPI